MELLNDLNLSLNTFLTNAWATGVKRNEYAEKESHLAVLTRYFTTSALYGG